MILSFAATAFTPTLPAFSTINVPFASGCIVLSNFTGILYCCAGQIEAGMQDLCAEVSQLRRFLKTQLLHRDRFVHNPRIVIVHAVNIRPYLATVAPMAAAISEAE